MWKAKQPYRDLGEDYFDRMEKARTAAMLIRRLGRLGYEIPLTPTTQHLSA